MLHPRNRSLGVTPTTTALDLRLPHLSRAAPYLVAVSGGRDSVALLQALLDAGFRRLTVCHFDHSLRGRASTGDARFVGKLAEGLGLPFELEKTDVQALAVDSGHSLETAARTARLAFFGRVARRLRCRTVFLGHHAGDQAETLLFNLFRGAGLAGLRGINPDCTQRVDPRRHPQEPGLGRAVTLRLIRPLLGISREAIDAFVTARGLRFREDASNTSAAYTRNRVRHELLPLAQEIFGRDVGPALCRTAEIVRVEDEWLAELASDVAPGPISVPELRAQPAALQRRRILGWLRVSGVPDVGFEEVLAVLALLEGDRSKINLPGNWHARRREKRLFLEQSSGDRARQPRQTPRRPAKPGRSDAEPRRA